MTRRRADRVVVLLAKWPRPGRAKRRLGATIGDGPAASLARAFLIDTIEVARGSGADRLLIAYAPRSASARFARVANGAELVAQPTGSFGSRLRHALAAGLAAGRRVVVIGMDSPTLPPSLLRRAFSTLRSARAVLGPAEDGGYYLIGSRGPLPDALFERMPWSTPDVARETLRRADVADLSVAVLPLWYDVDDAAGLRRLRTDRAGLARASATRSALEAAGLSR